MTPLPLPGMTGPSPVIVREEAGTFIPSALALIDSRQRKVDVILSLLVYLVQECLRSNRDKKQNYCSQLAVYIVTGSIAVATIIVIFLFVLSSIWIECSV